MSASNIAARVERGIRRGSAKLSLDGRSLTCSIVRPGEADESVYPPIPADPKIYTASVGLSNYKESDMDGTQIRMTDLKVMVSRPLVAEDLEETEPRNGDKMVVAGRTLDVVNVMPQAFGGYALFWVCQCRAGE